MSRWAITGTPIQNRLKDFFALLKFLQVHPYGDQRNFDNDITNLWKVGQHDEAVKRLKRLARCILLRRPPGTVELPPRKDLQCVVKFSPTERELYDSIRNQVICHIENTRPGASSGSTSSSYFNTLQKIEAMRIVCNMGVQYHSRHNVFRAAQSTAPIEEDWKVSAQRAFNLHRNMGSLRCRLCGLSPESVERFLADELSPPLFSRCLRFTCSDCVQMAPKQSSRCACGDEFECDTAPVSIAVGALEEAPVPGIDASQGLSLQTLPTKVAELVRQVRALPPHVKW